MVIFDSDVLIWILRGNERIKKRFNELVEFAGGHIYVTPIQVAEIMAGVRQSEKTDTEIFMKSLHCVEIDFSAGELAGQFMNKYGKSHNVTISDSLTAASVYLHKFKIWTLNRKHYPMLGKQDFI